MACSPKQGRALCFCVALHEEGRSQRREASAAEEKRIGDYLQKLNGGEAESEGREKRRELFVCLPPSSASAAASSSTPDAYSPRRLISRLLLSFNPSSQARNSGGGGEGLACRVRFPRYHANRKKQNEMTTAATTTSAEGSAVASGESMTELAINPVKKSDELSLNLGMGVGLVFLLTRSATEINKMVELREQMQILLQDIKDEFTQKKQAPPYSSASHKNPSSALHKNSAMEEDEAEIQSKYVRDRMEAELELELERMQCTTEGKASSLLPHQQRMKLATANPDPTESFGGSYAEVYDEGSGSQCGVSAHELRVKLNQLVKARQQEGIAELESSLDTETCCEDYGEITEVNEEEEEEEVEDGDISAGQLERRLHELLEARQQERIAQLECALECAERELREKEREVRWWRDTATIVSQHKNEALLSYVILEYGLLKLLLSTLFE
ncbi:hypothetical protein Cni_G28178 [Canna indica]|uniref:Protein POLAR LOCALIZATION DURING ASYMMETRIC DIVISION AND REDISTRIBUTION n=1 Tax=Canna indica TaxID=4628 RepID=A0AAQ3QSX1_9LILI|nr:hypothetical protein Cni_G28178 [Canna indica]